MPAALQRHGSCTDIGFTLRVQFQKDRFRPHQRQIIEAALAGFDVYVQAATSFGKSLCFQLPAVVDRGITIVVSPLLSLMVGCSYLTHLAALVADKRPADKSGRGSQGVRDRRNNTPYAERDRLQRDLETGHPRTRLLYVTPELCSGSRFRERLLLVHKQKELARVAIDEAHCISEWGHDFRKDFKRLSWFRETLPDVPIMCLTATANPRVRRDVLSILGLDAAPERTKSFLMSPQRSNLHLEIRYTKDEDDNRLSDFLRWIRGVYDRRRAEARKAELHRVGERPENVPGIIYTISRDECESLSAALRDEGVGARPFHAKLPRIVKEETLARWINNEPGYDIIVATTAFGMGIDKNNVRFVVHWRIPKSFEGYYQEAGRAGRDGNASYCFLYYAREDLERVTRMVRGDSKDGSNCDARLRSLHALALYCENTDACRHAEICKYFGETSAPECDFACDWHKDPGNLEMRFLRGVASEEWVSTQAMQGTYDGYYDE
ncbi:Bloom syndrome protein [Tolypocladium capitatum]|uniref:ATP-dependent DNA helicase n=1 Tax=Tolypocladium capitatum TaxID=45235 RepID=A0A2K3Q9U0_9HYPO|nr:Bloom syndrome protein [Tolypocladium capitatum]